MTASLSEQNVRQLVGITGDYENGSVNLSEEVVWIGRAVTGTPSTSSHLLFEDQSVSRVHGAFAWVAQYQSFAFHHRSQTNPTFVNDKVVTEPVLLKPGDVIAFGHQKLRFELCESQEPTVRSIPLPETPTHEPVAASETETEDQVPDDMLGWEVQDSDSDSDTGDESSETESAPVLPSISSEEVNSETIDESAPPSPGQPLLSPQVEPVPESEETGELEVKECPLNIAFKIRGKEYRAGATSSFSARFSPNFEDVKGPLPSEDGNVYFEIPARLQSEVSVQLLPDKNELKLKVEGSRTRTKRITETEHLTLEATIQDSGELPLDPADKISHQGAEFWQISAAEVNNPTASTASTLEMNREAFEAMSSKAHRGTLEFQTGDWKGSKITIFPSAEGLEIGPESKIGPYKLPLENCPTCRVSYDGTSPQVEVVEAADGQYVSINGELLFACQANPLVSGSGLFLGKYMLHWTQPEIQSRLSEYRLKFESNSLPISRAKVRIGTASHCEVLIDGQGLSPVTGTLECTLDGFFYEHLDSAIHAQVDGEVVLKGEKAEIKPGSIMQLGLGSELVLEKR